MTTLATTDSPLQIATWIPTLPFLAMIVCGILACLRSPKAREAAGWVTVGAIGLAFLTSCVVFFRYGGLADTTQGETVHYFQWINIGDFAANFSYFIDSLTSIMLFVVTGIGTLIAIYAIGYMKGDEGFARFFAYINLFIFAMTSLVMADNLVLLYLGWEGVGAASYLLIGYYYRKPSASAAAKKAFIVNRVGDFGFALGLMGIFLVFGTVQYMNVDGTGFLQSASSASAVQATGWQDTLLLSAIPFLLMLGAFGKSAQLPLHTWLPDAMEGPTPVSALIHAATMVTAGVYMIARLIPVFQLSEYALPVVATVGAVTALFAATIAMCQYDIKRIWAYSTVSQLGFMFLGVGVLGTVGAVFHLTTHAFFKALLFLTAGSVMHALAGQLDLRKMSGLIRVMPVTGWLMFIGCLALAGFPFTAGFYSKDTILADALAAYPILGWIAIFTAFLTAFYTFRLWFRVFLGETKYEMGNEHHGYPMDEHTAHDHTTAEPQAAAQPQHAPAHDHHAEPHEMPWLMNGPLVVLALGALFVGGLLYYTGFMAAMVNGSTAAVPDANIAAAFNTTVEQYHHDHHVAHNTAMISSIIAAIAGIALAYLFHLKRRDLADTVASMFAPLVTLFNRKYYVDELYDFCIVRPLHGLAWVAYQIDRFVVDGIVTIIAIIPRALAWPLRETQRGALHGYALQMAVGLAVLLLFVVATWKAMAAS
ncbi:MAG: NADH-quinone oxidoreductase subunit L [Phycisphaeraceae bacterium]